MKDKTAPWNALRSSDQKSRLEAQMVTQCRANIKLYSTVQTQTDRGRKMSKFYKELHDIHCHRPCSISSHHSCVCQYCNGC